MTNETDRSTWFRPKHFQQKLKQRKKKSANHMPKLPTPKPILMPTLNIIPKKKLEIVPPSPDTPRRKYLLARRKSNANPEPLPTLGQPRNRRLKTPDFDIEKQHHHHHLLPHQPGHIPWQVHHLAEQERAETKLIPSSSQQSTPRKKIKLGRGERDIRSLIDKWGRKVQPNVTSANPKNSNIWTGSSVWYKPEFLEKFVRY